MIRLIAAIDQRQGIAKHGIQPWYIPDDDKYFVDQTARSGGVVVMGKTTFEVIGHPLAGRRNIVLSRTPGNIEGAEFSQDLEGALNAADDVWVIGGASVFEQTVASADRLYLTHIEADFGCDQFFPDFASRFSLSEESELHTQNGFIFRYAIYDRLANR